MLTLFLISAMVVLHHQFFVVQLIHGNVNGSGYGSGYGRWVMVLLMGVKE